MSLKASAVVALILLQGYLVKGQTNLCKAVHGSTLQTATGNTKPSGHSSLSSFIRDLPNVDLLRATFHESLLQISQEKQVQYFYKPFDRSEASRHRIDTYVDDTNYPQSIGAGFKEPQTGIINFYDGERDLTFYQGDFFFGSFYHSHFFGADKKLPPHHIDDLAKEQPWFEWNPETKKYKFKTEGVRERLISHILEGKNSVRLYRGASIAEVQFWETEMKNAPNEKRLYLARSLFYKARTKGVFFTPSIEAAHDFAGAQGKIIAVDLSKDQLIQMVEKNAIYFGVENGYIEICIFDENLVSRFPEMIFIQPDLRGFTPGEG